MTAEVAQTLTGENLGLAIDGLADSARKEAARRAVEEVCAKFLRPGGTSEYSVGVCAANAVYADSTAAKDRELSESQADMAFGFHVMGAIVLGCALCVLLVKSNEEKINRVLNKI